MENYRTIKDILKEIIKTKKVEVFSGRIGKDLFPGLKKEEWVEVVGLTRTENCAGGFELVIKRKGKKTRRSCAVSWFKEIRINNKKQ